MALSNWAYDPFFDIRNIHGQVDDIFNGFFTDRQVSGNNKGGQQRSNSLWLPVVDVKEGEKGITIHAELPGIKKEDINIEVRNNRLTISGETKSDEQFEDKGYAVKERRYGKFMRALQLPPGIKVFHNRLRI